MKKFGYFTFEDPQLTGIKFGNWGSRPFEYFWCDKVDSAKGMKVIDLGTGLPSEHNWHRNIQKFHNPELYVGIDFDSRIKNEEINQDKHKMLWMDMTDLKFPDGHFNMCYSISTFEHIPKAEDFFKAINEIHRVLQPRSKMIVTLDEVWDVNNQTQAWNDLERDLLNKNIISRSEFNNTSFNIRQFASLISDKFDCVDNIKIEDIPVKSNANTSLLHHPFWNSTVSFGVFTRK